MHRGRGIKALGHGAFDGGDEGRLSLAQRWVLTLSLPNFRRAQGGLTLGLDGDADFCRLGVWCFGIGWDRAFLCVVGSLLTPSYASLAAKTHL